ncbi:MAG: restriction endonuclease subunit S, partial [Planctomycetales bacterium]
VPNGDLENSSLAYVRHYIRQRANLLAVVHLPEDTFIPFGTGVKTSVLFLEKKQSHRIGTENINTPSVLDKNATGSIFFGQVTKLGYLANKNGSVVYQKDDDGRRCLDELGQPLVDEDISATVARYLDFQAGQVVDDSDDCFTFPSDQLEDRFDLEYYKPSHQELERVLLERGAKPLAEVVNIVKRRSPKLQVPEQEVTYIELADIDVRYAEICAGNVMRVHELPSRATFEIRAGDIITAVAGNSTGSSKHMSAWVTPPFDGAVCTNGFRILEPKDGVEPLYLLYYLRTPYFLKQVYRYRTGAAIPAISDDDLARVLVFLPSLAEQKELAAQVEQSFALRKQSREVLQSIELDLP